MTHRLSARALVVVAFASAACSRPRATNQDSSPPVASTSHVDEPEHRELPKRLRLSPEVIADAQVRTQPVAREVLAATLELPGEVAANPDKTARVASPVAGRIERVAFQEGGVVAKGDLLAVMRVPELGRVRAAFAATSVRATTARTNAERLQALTAKRLAAEQESLAAKAEADALDAEARALGEQLSALGAGTTAAGNAALLPLRAPIAGVVITRDAVVGQPVTADQTLATITDLDDVWFLGRVFEQSLRRIALGDKAEVLLNAYPQERFEGTVEYLGRQIDPIGRTITARIRLRNHSDRLRLGLFGTATVATHDDPTKPAVLVVPRSALVEIAGKPVVFVRQSDDDFERHDVILGVAAPGKVEVVRGLREGEQVVVEGAFPLKSLVLKSTLAEDD